MNKQNDQLPALLVQMVAHCTSIKEGINRFGDKAAILISIVSKDIMGCSGAKRIYVFAPRASHNSYLKQKISKWPPYQQNGLWLSTPVQA